MFKRAFQEKRNFAPDNRASEHGAMGVDFPVSQIILEPAGFVEGVISRLDEIVAEGLGKDSLSAFSAA